MAETDEVAVLVVDDSQDFADVIALVLTEKGYSVRTASNGVLALELVEQTAPHCVILDVQMPEMNGHEFARTLKTRFGDDIVLIAISGHAPTDVEVAATFEIVDHYFQKPVELRDLAKILPALR